jgi:hypothetical protein
MTGLTGPEGADASHTLPRKLKIPADVMAYVLALSPVLGILWASPVFITQDGPAHLYNAQILRWTADGREPALREVYQVRQEPLPNWAGHALLLFLLEAGLAPLIADRIVVVATLAGTGAAVLALRRACNPGPPSAGAGLLSGILALNITWLFGFSSFLIGLMLGLGTISLAWSWRDRREVWRILTLSGLLILGYFCHLVSLGLTCLTILVFTLRDGEIRWGDRFRKLALLFAPLLPLAVWHSMRMSGAGGLAPRWLMLEQGNLFRRIVSQLTWIDPLTLGQKSRVPLVGWQGLVGYLVTPVVLLGAAALVAVGNGWYWRKDYLGRERWLSLASGPHLGRTGALFLAASLICPDTLAPAHGNYLPQRVALWGLALGVAGIPGVPLGRISRQIVGGLLFLAWGMQVATVFEYARWCEREVSPFLALRDSVRPGDRIATLLIEVSGPFRSNPILHADNLLGCETPCVIWNDYEARHYYFPVTFRADRPHPDPFAIERMNLMDGPVFQSRRKELWRDWLENHGGASDALVTRGRNQELERITSGFFEQVLQIGRIIFWRKPREK